MATTERQTCALCDTPGSERTRFFQRQLVTASDLTQDQAYYLEKLRRHNRMLHGWGVVCGARCKKGPGDCEVVIEPGYILGPYGDEIVIDREVTIDACKQDLDGNVAGPCGQPADPWCSNVRVDRRAGDKLYVAVRYAECLDRPVRVMSAGCGCDPQDCEYSRIRDSYVLRVLPQLPATYREPMTAPDPRSVLQCRDCGRPCPPCPEEPWVILADVTLGSDGSIVQLDCFAHRRHVVSLAEFYFLCQPQAPLLLKVGSVTIRNSNSPDDQGVTLSGKKPRLKVPSGFRAIGIEVSFTGAPVEQKTVQDSNTFKVEVKVEDQWLPVQGSIKWITDKDTFFWLHSGNLRVSTYRVTLVGAGDVAIRSIAGSPLDGEFLALPSGNDKPGGNFIFEFDVVRND